MVRYQLYMRINNWIVVNYAINISKFCIKNNNLYKRK